MNSDLSPDQKREETKQIQFIIEFAQMMNTTCVHFIQPNHSTIIKDPRKVRDELLKKGITLKIQTC